MRDRSFGGLLACLLLLSMPAWALGPEAQAIKGEGMGLYNIQHSTAALPYAQQGKINALYL